jgi:hypothetical protein
MQALLPYLLTTSVASTQTILFSEMFKFFWNLVFFQLTKTCEGKILNLQEYFNCQK